MVRVSPVDSATELLSDAEDSPTDVSADEEPTEDPAASEEDDVLPEQPVIPKPAIASTVVRAKTKRTFFIMMFLSLSMII